MQRNLGRTSGCLAFKELRFHKHLYGNQFRVVERLHIFLPFATDDDQQWLHEKSSGLGNYRLCNRGISIQDFARNFHFVGKSQSEIYILRRYDWHGVRKNWLVNYTYCKRKRKYKKKKKISHKSFFSPHSLHPSKIFIVAREETNH